MGMLQGRIVLDKIVYVEISLSISTISVLMEKKISKDLKL